MATRRPPAPIITAGLLAIAVAAIAAAASAQNAAVFYVYDVLNRLSAVVDQQGNAATYAYDAVGNIIKIDRFDVGDHPGRVAISMFTPSSGAVGTTVQVFGKGFGAAVAQNALTFNGRAAVISAAAPNRLVVTVPAGATTGPLAVTTPSGAATSGRDFRVLGNLAVSPEVVTARVGSHASFSATDSAAPTTHVRWAVNGITGGDTVLGTITADGLYTAPAAIPVPPSVTVTATHTDDASLTASAVVTILPTLNLLIASRSVTVALAPSPTTSNHGVTTRLSVRVGQTSTPIAAGPAVSVLSSQPFAALGVATLVSAQVEPLILGLDPASAAAGGATFTLTITGRGLTGATSLSFLRNNVVDPAITVANLSVNPAGTQASADVSIGAAAVPGARVARLATPMATSTPAGTGGNVFAVQ